MSKNLKFLLESCADGEGKLARRRNIKSASFHARSDSEIYTTEYCMKLTVCLSVCFLYRCTRRCIWKWGKEATERGERPFVPFFQRVSLVKYLSTVLSSC